MLLLEQILHSKKLNYNTLTPLISKYMTPKQSGHADMQTVNVFIDFWDIIKPLYNPKTIDSLKTLKVHERFMISSEIINIVAHYRHFFYSRMHAYTNIIFYYSDIPDSFRTSILPEYKEAFYEKRLDKNHPTFSVINEIMSKNINLIKLFCEYVPHTYLINTGNIEPSMLPNLFLSDNSKLSQNIINKNDLSIIISNEKIHYQDLNLQDRVLQLELRGKEKSRFVASEDIITILIEKSKKEHYFSILPDMYSLVLGLSGYTPYSIKGVKRMGVIKSLQFIQKQLDTNNLKNIEYDNIESLSSLEGVLSEEDLDKLTQNLKVLNNNMHEPSDKDLINIEMQIIDRIDAKSVRYVNDKYFTKYPILLEYVFEGEDYE